MSFLTRVANGLGTLLGVLTDKAVTLIQEVKRGYQEFQRNSGKTTEEVKSEAQRNRERLREINDIIIDYRNRYKSGGLSERDMNRWRNLNEERDELLDKNRQVKEVLAAEKIIENESVVEKIEIDLSTTHVLQYNAFADAINKTCRKCGRPMKLQWRRDLSVAGPHDFYWGCIGWYFQRSDGSKVCNHKEALTRNDFGLMTNTSEPEFALSAEDFGIIVDDPGTSSVILERVGDLRSDLAKRQTGVELVSCPHHGEHMVLKKKSKPGGLLDTFFLACPHWKPNDEGCSYMEKLKSGAQLSALLKSQTGRGIL